MIAPAVALTLALATTTGSTRVQGRSGGAMGTTTGMPRRALLLGGCASALPLFAARPAGAFVEGVCIDGQAKWKLYREGKLPEPPGGACEEFSYTERPGFKALPEEAVVRKAQAQAEQAERDAAFRDAFLSRRSKPRGGRAELRGPTAGSVVSQTAPLLDKRPPPPPEKADHRRCEAPSCPAALWVGGRS